MTEGPVSDPQRGIGGSGYDLEALSAYADRGRRPAIAAIDGDPECQAVLDGIDRLGALSQRLVAAETAASAPDEGWVRSLLDTISREARAGRDVPFPGGDPATTIAMTEGAIREAVRAAGDAVPGVLVGRVVLRWDDDPRDAELEVAIAATLERPFLATADLVRAAVGAALGGTPIRARSVDVTIEDLHLPAGLPIDDAGR